MSLELCLLTESYSQIHSEICPCRVLSTLSTLRTFKNYCLSDSFANHLWNMCTHTEWCRAQQQDCWLENYFSPNTHAKLPEMVRHEKQRSVCSSWATDNLHISQRDNFHFIFSFHLNSIVYSVQYACTCISCELMWTFFSANCFSFYFTLELLHDMDASHCWCIKMCKTTRRLIFIRITIHREKWHFNCSTMHLLSTLCHAISPDEFFFFLCPGLNGPFVVLMLMKMRRVENEWHKRHSIWMYY